MTHEELALMQELLQKMGNCKTSASNECQLQMKQSDSSKTDGSTSELYQMEKWSSKNRLRDNSKSGPKGLRQYVIDGNLTKNRLRAIVGLTIPLSYFLSCL
jgi:hypothetical protein